MDDPARCGVAALHLTGTGRWSMARRRSAADARQQRREAADAALASLLRRPVDPGARAPGSGKPPRLDGGGEYSVGYSAGELVVAVCGGGPVGVDIEVLRPRPTDRLFRRACSPAERERAAGLDDGQRLNALYRLWTAKEALLKATGEGLAGTMATIGLDALAVGGCGDRTVEVDRDGTRWSLFTRLDRHRAIAVAVTAECLASATGGIGIARRRHGPAAVRR